ncbi:mannosyl-oligosaccharide alpha-1,2-mannosidase, partial [Tulasnella sp. 419]
MDSKAFKKRRKNNAQTQEHVAQGVQITNVPRKKKQPPSLALRAFLGVVGLLLVVATYWSFDVISKLRSPVRRPIEVLSDEPLIQKMEKPSPPPKFTTPYVPVFTEDTARKEAIIAAFKHAWKGYERDAWGYDDYNPLTRGGTNLGLEGSKGVGYTIIDSLDTMIIMAQNEAGIDEELNGMLERANAWIENELDFDNGGIVNTFETTIRLIGGLLSAQHLTHKDPTQNSIYLSKAIDLADRLLPAFDTPTGLPLTNIHLRDREGHADPDNSGWCSIAEVSSLQLEFKYLAQLTGNEKYWRTVERAMQVVRDAFPPRSPRLPSIFIRPDTGRFVPFGIRVGSRGDSYYEILLKQYLLTNRTEYVYREMYDESMDAVTTRLMRRSPVQGLVHTVELYPFKAGDKAGKISLLPKQDHLVCYLGGLFLLGVTEGFAPVPPKKETFRENQQRKLRDWSAAMNLIETCMEIHDTATGLAAEITYFETERVPAPEDEKREGKDWYIKVRGATADDAMLDPRFILRPETIESLFVAFRITGDPKYREYGWKIFQSIEKHCKLPDAGYTSIRNVDKIEGDAGREDRLETFFLSETLKYL